jgi:CRISPR-associated protein Cas1
MTQSADATRDLLPARMLNEFVYCPRLFYYEHVEGVFLHNADTKRGAAEHTRVDTGKGDLPPPASPTDPPSEVSDLHSAIGSPSSPPPATAETIHARSVMLGSETLGVVAKLDLVEVSLESALSLDLGDTSPPSEIPDCRSEIRRPLEAARVCPVEYKSGAPREDADGARQLWDADRMQLGLQILLLRENGYTCDEGVLFYRQTRQRVRYQLTPDDETWIRRGVAAARTCAAGPIPPPLDHSPKCPRCSLVSICLPDETLLLRSSGAPDDDAPPRIHQLDLPGLASATETSPTTDAPAAPGTDPTAAAETLAAALAADDPDLDRIPEPRPPRVSAEGTVRRLIAPDIDTKPLYVSTPGVAILKQSETVVIKEDGAKLAEVRLKDLHQLAIFGPASLSTALVQTLCERDIPISYFSLGGWFYGLTRGHSLTNVFTRIRQFAVAADREHSLPLARLFVYGKIRNQRTLLMRNHLEPPPLVLRALKHAASAALIAPHLPALLGIEGAAALVYFRHFAGMIKGPDEDELPGLEDDPSRSQRDTQLAFPFDFRTRNRRPPRDPVNALLSLGYALLARDCTVAAHTVGCDAYVGFLHQPRFGRPALALDLMEEFRPLIADSVVLTLINNRMISPYDFVRAGDAVNLSPAGRKKFLHAYEKRMGDTITHPVFDYKVSYRRAIELQFRLLARTLTGEITRYVPFTTR